MRTALALMYNGVGLTSVRGTATNGYVQRNLAHSKPKVNIDYAKEAEKAYAKPSLGRCQNFLLSCSRVLCLGACEEWGTISAYFHADPARHIL